MAKSKLSTRTQSRKSAAADRPPSLAERRKAIRYLRKHSGGAHVPRPTNRLIQDAPGATIDRCQGIISWLAHIEKPFSGGALDAAEADVLLMVCDALEHASTVVHSIGAQADAEVAHG